MKMENQNLMKPVLEGNLACAFALREWLRRKKYLVYRKVYLALLFVSLLTSAATGASVTLAWDASAGAVDYVVWSGPVGRDYDRAAITTNTTHTVTNLASGAYRFAVWYCNGTSGSEIAEVTAVVRPITFWLEKSSTLDGPWRAIHTNTTEVVEAKQQTIYHRVMMKR
jgi:hypothetical protein